MLRRRQEEARTESSHRRLDERSVGVVETRAFFAADRHAQFVDRCRTEQARELRCEVVDPVFFGAVIAYRTIRARLARVTGCRRVQGGRAGHVVTERHGLSIRKVEVGSRREGPSVVRRLERLLKARIQVIRLGARLPRDPGQARKLDLSRRTRILEFQRGEEEGRVAAERPAYGAARLAQRFERLCSEGVFQSPASIPDLVKRIAVQVVGSALRRHV